MLSKSILSGHLKLHLLYEAVPYTGWASQGSVLETVHSAKVCKVSKASQVCMKDF